MEGVGLSERYNLDWIKEEGLGNPWQVTAPSSVAKSFKDVPVVIGGEWRSEASIGEACTAINSRML